MNGLFSGMGSDLRRPVKYTRCFLTPPMQLDQQRAHSFCRHRNLSVLGQTPHLAIQGCYLGVREFHAALYASCGAAGWRRRWLIM